MLIPCGIGPTLHGTAHVALRSITLFGQVDTRASSRTSALQQYVNMHMHTIMLVFE